jgi:hypothetical protein
VNAHAAAEELRALLEEERIAIRTMDSAAVAASAERKVRLLEVLSACAANEQQTVVTELGALLPELKRNGVLLAHARDCLRDAIAATRGGLAEDVVTRRATAPAIRPGRRVSTRG